MYWQFNPQLGTRWPHNFCALLRIESSGFEPHGTVSRKSRKHFGPIFSSSVSKNREVYTPEMSCIKRTSVDIKNMWIKQLCNHKV